MIPISNDSAEPSHQEEFVQLLTRHLGGVRSYIGTLLPNCSDADEVMQETSLILWRKWREFDRSASFFHWACGVAYFEVLRYRRGFKPGKMQFDERLLEQIAAEKLVQSDLLEARQDALQDCLTHLKKQDRELVEGRYREEVSVEALAKKSSRTASAIYKALERIRGQLLECVQRRLGGGEHRV